jgi:hypothetical protein
LGFLAKENQVSCEANKFEKNIEKACQALFINIYAE